jgi:Polysaccharide deacetylase
VSTFPTNHSSCHPGDQRSGQLVISLDFELFWGVRHRVTVQRYSPNLIGARAVIPVLLDLFSEYRIHATWAIVGFLFFDQTSTLLKFVPSKLPQYNRRNLSPYCDLPSSAERENDESIFFAPSLITLIANTPNQEIGSHTFSHYFCLEAGQNIEAFQEDLFSACAAARSVGVELRSLIFPQNQCREDFLKDCAKVGITAYRGNLSSWLYRATSSDKQGYVKRLCRLLDAYFPVSSCTCHPLPRLAGHLPINVPASRFLRPYTKMLRTLEPLRLRRIKKEMTVAARKKLLYHLWWHPHNFGQNTADNLAFLRAVFDHYRVLRQRYGFESVSMKELADDCIKNHN